jgi:hypothetical protein
VANHDIGGPTADDKDVRNCNFSVWRRGGVAMRRFRRAVMGHGRADVMDMKRWGEEFNAARRRILASVAGIALPRSEPPQPFNKAAHGDLETTGLSRSAD